MTSPRLSLQTEARIAVNMEPTTDSEQHVGLEIHAVDVTLYALSILLFGISCYVFLVLCIYMRRFLRKRRRSSVVASSSVLANGYGKIALAMRFAAVVISLLCFAHFILQLIALHSDCCDRALQKTSQLIFGSVLMLSYLFFWLRQRVLYDAPAMKAFNSKLLRTLSWCFLGFVVVNCIAQIITTSLLHRISNPTWVYSTWLTGCVIVQGCLMALFLYPLQKHGLERKKAFNLRERRNRKSPANGGPRRVLSPAEANGVEIGIRDSNIFTVSSSKSRKGSMASMKRSALAPATPMFRAARRCFVCAVVAFATDVVAGTAMVVASCVNWDTHEAMAVLRFLLDLDLVVNSVFVVGCFANWRSILFPKCFREVVRKDEYVSSTTESEMSPSSLFANCGYFSH